KLKVPNRIGRPPFLVNIFHDPPLCPVESGVIHFLPLRKTGTLLLVLKLGSYSYPNCSANSNASLLDKGRQLEILFFLLSSGSSGGIGEELYPLKHFLCLHLVLNNSSPTH